MKQIMTFYTMVLFLAILSFVGCVKSTDKDTKLSDSSDGSGESIVNEGNTSNSIDEAISSFNSYSITFNRNDSFATGEMERFKVENNNQLLPACSFTNIGYIFAGWATSPSGVIVYKDNDPCPESESNLILYAVWVEPEYLTDGDFRYFETHGEVTIVKYLGSSTNVIIPETIDEKPVTALYSASEYAIEGRIPDYDDGIDYKYEDGVFYNMDFISSIVVPDTVITIGHCAFRSCDSLVSIDLPDTLISMGSQVFYDCDALTSIEIPDSVSAMGSEVFFDCQSLTTAILSESLTMLGNSTFLDCVSLTSVDLPDSISRIEYFAFSGCIALKTVNLPESLTLIGYSAFTGCTALERVEIPKMIGSFDGAIFRGCSSLEEFTVHPENKQYIAMDGVLFSKDQKELVRYPVAKSNSVYICPESVEVIGSDAFYGCTNLTSIELSDSVTKIDRFAFYNCSGLTSIELPASLAYIGVGAFGSDYGVDSLVNVTIHAQVPPSLEDGDMHGTVFKESINGFTIAVPSGSERSYKSAPGWRDWYASAIISQ